MVEILAPLAEELRRVPSEESYALDSEGRAVDQYAISSRENRSSAYCKSVPCQCIAVKCY